MIFCFSLTSLNLSNNALRSVPPELAGCRKLASLDLSFNAIEDMAQLLG